MIETPSPAHELLPALQRLDSLLERALRRAEQMYGQPNADPYRGLYVSEEEASKLLARPAGAPLFAADAAARPTAGGRIEGLVSRFGLSEFDVDLVIIALAPELDLRYERLFAYLQDDVTRKRPSVDLALNLLCVDAADKIERRRHFAPEAALRRDGLLHVLCDSGQVAPPLLSCYMKLDDQVVKFLLGLNGLDARLSACADLSEARVSLDDLLLDQDLKNSLAALGDSATGGRPIRVYLQGPPGSGKRSIAQAIARRLARPLLTIDAALTPAFPAEFAATIDLALREAQFLDAVVHIDRFDALTADDRQLHRQHVAHRLATYPSIVFVGGSSRWVDGGRTHTGVLHLTVPRPEFDARLALWRGALEREGLGLDDREQVRLANRFTFTPRQIDRAVVEARNQRGLRFHDTPRTDQPTVLEDVIASAREQCRHNLGALASRVDTHVGWDDIVLPQDVKAQLLEICNQAEHRYLVYGAWGFGRKVSNGKGLNVLASGPPGVGKTMFAAVIANRLRLDLYKIDLSQVVSKYIGETEKNVGRVFAEARASNAILFFDEADALFGRRSEVRDAHDRYANVEIAFLLQQMDDYEGISILATNLKQNIDDAFLRRLAFTVEFPFPNESSRRQIWERAWPADVPLDSAVDFDLLARQFRFSGGSIKNAVVAAAFLGARRGRVDMVDLLMAARRESEKHGKAPSTADYGPWWDAVQARARQEWEEARAS